MKTRPISTRLLSLATYGISTALGVFSLIYPFVLPSVIRSTPIGQARVGDLPLTLTLLLGLCLLVLLYEVQGQDTNTKLIALLGVLVAINAALRFLEVAIPGPGGFSPIFFLIVLTGYVFDGRFGFLLGVLTLFVSAIITGGVGPWLPGQMFAAGWVGMSAPLCRPLVRWFRVTGRKGEAFILATFGALWGLVFGIIMNLWSWPFISGPAGQYWSPDLSWVETLQSYVSYYLVTSLVWDVARASGNVLLILSFGVPTLRALRRFRRRFSFDYHPSRIPDLASDFGGRRY